MRTYTELSKLPTMEERFEYLRLDGEVGVDTFGFDRYLNQIFYMSPEWKRVRNQVIIRDNGYDLGLIPNPGKVIIHHMNPITKDDVLNRKESIMNPEYLICVSHQTHNAIHYGTAELLPKDHVDRSPNDTCPWKK